MTPIRHLGWTALALLALVGCDAPAPPTTPPGTAPSGAPEAGKTSADLKPAPDPAGKDDTVIKAVPVEPTPPGGTKAEEPKKEGAAVNKLSDEEIAEIKKLPAAEQPIALAQVTCPVSDEHLGEMGAPIKQVIGDKTFFICCASCEKKVKADPEAVLAKLKK